MNKLKHYQKVSNEWDYLVNKKNSLSSKIFNFFVNFLVLKIINTELANSVIKNLKKKKIIEFGCGRATTSSLIFYKKSKVKISVLDNNYQIIKYLKKKTNFNVIEANCLDKNIRKIGNYCISFSSGTFEHFNKSQRIIYIKNMMKISRYGIIAVPAKNIFWNAASFIRSYTDKKNKSIWFDDFEQYDIKKIQKIFSTLNKYQLTNIRYTYNFFIKTFLIFEFKKK